MSDERVAAGMRRQLELRRRFLDQGARPLGWKVGFNVPALQERLGLDAPVAGFLTSAALLEDGAVVSFADRPVVVECEVAVELGPDGRSIAAFLPALELADPPDFGMELEDILAGNVFHRAVAFGPRREAEAPGAGRILVNGEEREALTAERTSAQLAEMVDAIARRVADAGEEVRPGERIITGVLAPPHPATPGDLVRLELEAVGGVELRFED